MRPLRTLRALLTAGFFVLAAASSGEAADISFQGAFSQDDDLAFFTFTLAADATVTIKTLSYGGGVNAAGTTIVAGGFDPVLSLFAGNNDPTGLLIGLNNDGSCPPLNNDPVTGACWDALVSASLTAGVYTLALSQSDNTAIGPFLADGFLRSGQGNFTGPTFLGIAGSFVDANPAQRTSQWAVDILNVTQATGPGATVPEPTTVSLMLIGITAAAAARRRRL